MSNNNRSNGFVAGLGLAAIGAGVVAALAYGAYDYYQQNFANEGNSSHRPNPRPRIENSSPTVSTRNPQLCPICKKNLHLESVFKLRCNHSFHKTCIQANCVFNSIEEEYKCPITDCKKIISPTVIEEMFAD